MENEIGMSDIEAATQSALQSIQNSSSLDELEHLRVNLLGKSGSITSQLKQLGALPPEQRKLAGEAVNRAKEHIADALAARKHVLEEAAFEHRLASEKIDITLPGRGSERGNLHPVSRTLERITDIFARLGYQLADGPEIEDDWHNFEALNFPPHHPARAMHDTF
jgi:phenylalanyl-tRNA synthetase alpha chain